MLNRLVSIPRAESDRHGQHKASGDKDRPNNAGTNARVRLVIRELRSWTVIRTACVLLLQLDDVPIRVMPEDQFGFDLLGV